MKLLEEGRDRYPGFTDAACEALGCVDPRTALKHIRTLRAAVDAKLPILAELLASLPGPSEGPAFPPGTNPFAILCLFRRRFLKAAQELSGSLVPQEERTAYQADHLASFCQNFGESQY